VGTPRFYVAHRKVQVGKFRDHVAFVDAHRSHPRPLGSLEAALHKDEVSEQVLILEAYGKKRHCYSNWPAFMQFIEGVSFLNDYGVFVKS
jgi:hypothetical protein